MFLLVKIIGCVDEFFNVQCVFRKNYVQFKNEYTVLIICKHIICTMLFLIYLRAVSGAPSSH